MSGFGASNGGGGSSGGGAGAGFASLTPTRRAPPVPAAQSSQHSDPFLPPLASSYGSGASAASPASAGASGLPMGAGGGAGGGSYTGPLRPAGPQQSGSSFAQGTGWSGTPPAAAPGGGGGIVRKGYVGVKEDGIRSWIWSKRWLALREQTLTFHKNEVSWRVHARRGGLC